MLTLCGGCGHRLWSEIKNVGAFRFLAHFDDDEGSDTYLRRALPLLPFVRPEAGQGQARLGGVRWVYPPKPVALHLPYSPECVQGAFSELRAEEVLRSSQKTRHVVGRCNPGTTS